MSKPPIIFTRRSKRRPFQTYAPCPGSGGPPRPGTTGTALPRFAQCPTCWRRLALSPLGLMRPHAGH